MAAKKSETKGSADPVGEAFVAAMPAALKLLREKYGKDRAEHDGWILDCYEPFTKAYVDGDNADSRLCDIVKKHVEALKRRGRRRAGVDRKEARASEQGIITATGKAKRKRVRLRDGRRIGGAGLASSDWMLDEAFPLFVKIRDLMPHGLVLHEIRDAGFPPSVVAAGLNFARALNRWWEQKRSPDEEAEHLRRTFGVLALWLEKTHRQAKWRRCLWIAYSDAFPETLDDDRDDRVLELLEATQPGRGGGRGRKPSAATYCLRALNERLRTLGVRAFRSPEEAGWRSGGKLVQQ